MIETTYRVRCDGCRKYHTDTHRRWAKIETARKNAARDAWTTKTSQYGTVKDFCPACTALREYSEGREKAAREGAA